MDKNAVALTEEALDGIKLTLHANSTVNSANAGGVAKDGAAVTLSDAVTAFDVDLDGTVVMGESNCPGFAALNGTSLTLDPGAQAGATAIIGTANGNGSYRTMTFVSRGDGTYIVTYNSANTLSITASVVYLRGSFNNWQTTDAFTKTANTDIVSLVKVLPAGTYTFRVYNAGTDIQHGSSDTITDTANRLPMVEASACTLIVSGGTYEFKYELSTNKLSVYNEACASGHDLQYTDNDNGTHRVGCTRCSFVLTESEAHHYRYGFCSCGAAAEGYDAALTIMNCSLNLQSYIGVDYTVNHSGNSVLRQNYSSFYVAVQLGEKTEQILPVYQTIGTSHTAYGLKLTATQMTEALRATLCAVSTADGKTYRGPSILCSVRDGVMELLENETRGDEYRRLEADLLRYGAAAQQAFGVNTDDLADSQLGDYAQYATQNLPTIGGCIQSEGKGISFRTKSLALQSTIELQFMFNKGSYDVVNLEARIVYDGATHTVPLTAYGNKYATFSYDGLAPNEPRKPLTVAVYDKTTNAKVTEQLTGSVEAFAAEKLDSYAQQPAILVLLNAMMAYGDSAQVIYGS